MKISILILMPIFTIAQAVACSCVEEYPSLPKYFESSKVVAIMESQIPEEYEQQGWKHKKFKFITLETLKGEPLSEYEVIESEPRFSCARNVLPKTKYLVFHNEGKELEFSSCAATQLLEYIEINRPEWRKSIKDLKIWNEELQLENKF